MEKGRYMQARSGAGLNAASYSLCFSPEIPARRGAHKSSYWPAPLRYLRIRGPSSPHLICIKLESGLSLRGPDATEAAGRLGLMAAKDSLPPAAAYARDLPSPLLCRAHSRGRRNNFLHEQHRLFSSIFPPRRKLPPGQTSTSVLSPADFAFCEDMKSSKFPRFQGRLIIGRYQVLPTVSYGIYKYYLISEVIGRYKRYFFFAVA